jgi:alkylation response protein AidB-like acyl-CoA dehydrogenase
VPNPPSSRGKRTGRSPAWACSAYWPGPSTTRSTARTTWRRDWRWRNYGYAEEFGLEQRLRDVMAVEIADGTAQVQKIVIARERFGRAFLP